MSGLNAFERAMADMVARVEASTREMVAKAAADVEASVKKEFSGSHGRNEPHVGGSQPNVVTGNLRRSVTTDPITKGGPGIYSTRVYPTMVYARRIELGFSGADALGRIYNQPAFPYFGPGVRKALVRIFDIAETGWGEALR